MKIKTIACLTGFLLGLLPTARAQQTLTAWTFDNLPIAPNASPQPSAGFGNASAIGLGGGSNPDVQSLSGSSSGLANSWRVRATGANEGWSTAAPIGSQGAKFSASTVGFYRVKVSFDVYATTDAERFLQVQYTTDGNIWNNATITSVGTLGVIASNSSTSNNLVAGSYVILTNNGTTGWNNQITVDLSGISGVDNNANFAVRFVNAGTGTNCLTTTGAVYNNTSGNWTFDNVLVQGVSIDPIAQWTFESNGTAGFVPHPAPEFGSGTATSIGFDTSFTFSDGNVGSTNKPDTLNNNAPFSSSGPAGQVVWRVRGQGPGNGWFSDSPIGSQGAQFDVSTVNYSNVVLTFDLFFTSQAEAKMCVMYTTDGSTWSNATTLAYPPNPTFILTNSVSSVDYSPNTVEGTYFYQTVGQNFYNNLVVDFTGVPDVDNNPNFGVRIVNAAQQGDCVAFNGGSYNNSSGNCRFDNVTVGGEFNGSLPPLLDYDPTATVDGPFTNTFTDDPVWRSKISAVYVNGLIITNAAYTTNLPGMIVFTPSKATNALASSGIKKIVIFATDYSSAKVTQPLAPGVARKLTITTQPTAPSASGGTLVVNPALSVTDQFGNGSTNPYANVTVTATAAGTGGWTLGGSTVQPAINGVATFTNLSATANGSSAVSGAAITFVVTGYTNTSNGTTTTNLTSGTFNIGKPPVPFTPGNLAVLQIDSVANNTTFSIVEVKPSAAGQSAPVNIVPISATGTNALRQSSAGSTGRLTLSDDGTLVSFVGFADGNSATLDETFVLDRSVGTLNYTNQFTRPFTYTSTSLGGSQGRSCATLNNTNWIVVDKGGLYMDSLLWSAQNNIVARTFGGTPYIATQKTAGGSPIPVVYALAMIGPDAIDHAVPNNLGTDPIAVDFYLVSTNGGSSYDVMYILEQVSNAQGLIRKYSWVPDNTQISGYAWQTNGVFTNGNGADAIFATPNGNGGAYIYYTTGGGGTAGNAIIRLTDAGGWNAPLSIASSNVIYTTSGSTSIKGLTFAPQQTTNAPELIPPPVLLAQNGATVLSASVTVTNVPEVASWRSAITAITVNGSTLPPAAYDTTQAGKIVFFPSQSALLQTSGAKTIAIAATGFSTNTVTQNLASGPATQLAITTQPKAPAYSGSLLTNQPVVVVRDVLGNTVTNAASITAAAAGPLPITWTLGGSKTVTTSGATGISTFTNLTAFSASGVTGATISFTLGGLSVTSSPSFNIPAAIPAVLNGVALPTGKLAFAFTNSPGLGFSVLATNDLSIPQANWPVIGVAIESPAGSGHYSFTNSASATDSVQYYILRQP